MANDYTKYSDYSKKNNFTGVKFGVAKMTDKELNEAQQIQEESIAEVIRQSVHSGFVKLANIDFTTMATTPNTVKLVGDSLAVVNGYKITIPDGTLIPLNPPPAQSPIEALVFMEVWKEEVTKDSTIKTYGQESSATTETNNIYDVRANAETAHRVQLKYRLRAVDGVDFTANPEGVTGAKVRGALASDSIVNFVKSTTDMGLYTGTVTGAGIDNNVYAIPMFRIYRRPSCGFSDPDEYSKISPLITNPIHVQRVVDNTNVKHTKDGLGVVVTGRTLVNLVQGGNCEDLSKWATGSGCTVDTTLKLYGNISFNFVASASPKFKYIDIQCDQSHKYLVSGYAYISAYTSGTIDLNCRDYGTGSNPTSFGFDVSKLNQWQRKSGILTGKANGGFRLYIGNSNSSATATYNMDGIMVYDLTAMGLDTITDIPTLEAMLPFVDGAHSSKPIALKAKEKNLLNADVNSVNNKLVSYNATCVGDNNSLIVTALTTNPSSYVYYTVNLKPNTNYKIKCNSVRTGSSGGGIKVYDSSLITSIAGNYSTLSPDISFTVPNDGIVNIVFYAKTGGTALDSATFTNIQLEEGAVASAYQDYKASEAVLPSIISSLKSIGSVADTEDLMKGKLTQNISEWVTLDGSLGWAIGSTFVGFKWAMISVASLNNYSALGDASNIVSKVIKYNGIDIPWLYGSGISDCVFSGGANVIINLSNIDTGFVDSMTPTGAELKAYFYGWKMCNSDGSAWDGVSTKYWKKITDGTGITNVCPTTSYDGYTPYKMIYQLATPVVYDISDYIKGRVYVNPEITTFEVNQVTTAKAVAKALTPTFQDDFEGALSWNARGTYATSAISSSAFYSGSKSLNLIGTGAGDTGTNDAYVGTGAVNGHKVYVSLNAKDNGGASKNLKMYLSGIETTAVVNSTSWTKLSTVITATASSSMYLYSDNACNMYVDAVQVIDLTAMFGAGNEPDQAWCDKYLDFGTNYALFSPTGSTALGAQKNGKDSLLGAKNNYVGIPASKYTEGMYEIFYKEAPETFYPPKVDISIGSMTLSIKDSNTVGSLALTTTEVPYKKDSDGARNYLAIKPTVSTTINVGSTVSNVSLILTGLGSVKIGDIYQAPTNSVYRVKIVDIALDGTVSIQNVGTATIASWGGTAYVLSDRPDGLLTDIVADRDTIDIRHLVSLTGFNYDRLLSQEFDKFSRGENVNY